MPEDEAQRVRSIFAQIAAERRPFSGLININLHRNGRQVILETSGVPIFGPDGNFMGYRGMDRDVTEREHAEEILRESEAKFRSYIESAPLAVFVADREGRLVDFNPAATELLGYDAPTLRNMHIMDLHPEDDREEVLREFATLLNTGRVETECRMKKCDGQIIWVSLDAVMLSDRLSLGYCQDITERRLMQEQITAAAEQWQATFDSIQDQVMILDSEFRILRINSTAVSFFGLPLSRILASRCHNLMHGTDSAWRHALLRRRCRPGATKRRKSSMKGRMHGFWSLPTQSWTRPGMCLAWYTPQKTSPSARRRRNCCDNTRQERMMLTGRLISSQEEELRRLSRELHDDLTQRLAVLAMDAGMIEHQLRPLNIQAAEETRDLKRKLIEVSEEVHDLSRQLHPSILDDLGLVQAVQSECATFTKRNGITLSFVFDDVPDVIPNDISLCLYRVIQEGLRNIDRHAKTNEARIALQGLDGGVALLIQDAGIGFDAGEVQIEIRHRFSRYEGAGTARRRHNVLKV